MNQSVYQIGDGDKPPVRPSKGRTGRSPYRGDRIPKVPLYLAISVVVFSLLVVFSARFMDIGTWKLDTGKIIQSRDVVFLLQDDQRIIINDAKSGETIDVMPAEEEGFIRGILRATKRERMVQRVAADAPMRIIQGERGSYVLIDLATEREFYLRAFGADNAEAIGRYITLKPQTTGGAS